MTGKTASGFKFKSNPKIANDWRFIKALARIEKGDVNEQIVATTDLVTLILGNEGEEALCKHLADKDGCVPTDKLIAEVGEIVRIMQEELKNS